MARLSSKNLGSCIRELKVINGKTYLKFKKSKKCQSAQDLVDSVNTKIIIK